MGIKPETDQKVKNLEDLSEEEKKEILEATQRAGFNPILYQVRVMFDLIGAIRESSETTKKYNTRLIILTYIIAALTFLMLIGLGIQIWLYIK